MKSIILLSTKSSGSTAVQKFLTSYPHIHHIKKTRHFADETLFWVKAASVLDLPQMDMAGSEVPIEKNQARQDLIDLLNDNIDNAEFSEKDDDETLIFEGWRKLCEAFQPIFFEKSPHHLFQRSALELIQQGIERNKDIETLIIALVRNPMDTLYSYWRRWKGDKVIKEQEVMQAYKNLKYCQELFGDRLQIIHYERMASYDKEMDAILGFCEITDRPSMGDHFHTKSIQKWKKDRRFDFQLSEEVFEIARELGYSPEELINDRKKKKRFWFF